MRLMCGVIVKTSVCREGECVRLVRKAEAHRRPPSAVARGGAGHAPLRLACAGTRRSLLSSNLRLTPSERHSGTISRSQPRVVPRVARVSLQKKRVNIKADYAESVDKWNIQLISGYSADTRNIRRQLR